MISIYKDNHKFEKTKIASLTVLLFLITVNTGLFVLSAIKVFYHGSLLFLATSELILGVLTLTFFLLLKDDMYE